MNLPEINPYEEEKKILDELFCLSAMREGTWYTSGDLAKRIEHPQDAVSRVLADLIKKGRVIGEVRKIDGIDTVFYKKWSGEENG